ncbi:hypothetical protein F5876DRAFT_90227 [Lentinula aff. lateritia]|uniref:Uncharacterized protein n=1 Tax=Lentinula aff. lateritia TaxID=2804960 RepID=A0ACC1TUC9_9AGAR|nr:hypothetical protein F5876DRAFT_90227 [Lentinula aff. lateritia]
MQPVPILKQWKLTVSNLNPDQIGSHLLRSWIREWIRSRDLPRSSRALHAKVFSMLSDPALQSMSPDKLLLFINKEMLPTAAKDYVKHITGTKMPEGLKKYLELELFPHIGLKWLVLVAHNVMTAQANDGKWSWVFEGEHAIQKKGVGHGIHQSNVICLTYGWLKDASQTLEYGKNYNGYWNGELFIKQLKEKIIPTFEQLHGPQHQALFLIDNSQGHAAYAEDALLVTQMNFNPGGKQAQLCNVMIFPHDHPQVPKPAKGDEIKKYLCDHCDYTFDTLKANMSDAMGSVLCETSHRWEHHTHRWIAAYCNGLDAEDAQAQVKAFSSKKYKSHRRIPESLAAQFDV